MNMESFVILALATWRLSSLFANEHGPGSFVHNGKTELGLFDKIRLMAGAECPNDDECFGKNWIAKGLLCEWCNSVWFGTGLTIAYLIMGSTLILIALPLALSAVTIIVKYLIEALRK